MGGVEVATYREQDLETEVVLSVENGVDGWAELSVRSRDGALVSMRDLVHRRSSAAPRELLHVDRRRAVALRLRGTPTTSVAELRKLAASALPAARVRTLEPVSVDAERW
jgi:multidrug efflux pump subunit AcrB